MAIFKPDDGTAEVERANARVRLLSLLVSLDIWHPKGNYDPIRVGIAMEGHWVYAYFNHSKATTNTLTLTTPPVKP